MVSWRLLPRQLQRAGGTERLFCSLYGCQDARDTFWLDRWTSTTGNCHTAQHRPPRPLYQASGLRN